MYAFLVSLIYHTHWYGKIFQMHFPFQDLSQCLEHC